MTNIMKKDKNGQPSTFVNVVDQLFQNNLSRFFDDSFWGADNRHIVPVNICETASGFELEVVAPGLRKEDFKLNLAKDILTVSFDAKEENKETDQAERWIRREYKRQAFTRSFTLDETVDPDRITAKYENGVLKLTLPKNENAMGISREIEIR